VTEPVDALVTSENGAREFLYGGIHPPSQEGAPTDIGEEMRLDDDPDVTKAANNADGDQEKHTAPKSRVLGADTVGEHR